MKVSLFLYENSLLWLKWWDTIRTADAKGNSSHPRRIPGPSFNRGYFSVLCALQFYTKTAFRNGFVQSVPKCVCNRCKELTKGPQLQAVAALHRYARSKHYRPVVAVVLVSQTFLVNRRNTVHILIPQPSHFYRAALYAGRSSREKCVCSSVKRVDCDRTEEKSVQILYRTKDHLPWFSEKKNGWNFGSNWPRWSEIADFQSIRS